MFPLVGAFASASISLAMVAGLGGTPPLVRAQDAPMTYNQCVTAYRSVDGFSPDTSRVYSSGIVGLGGWTVDFSSGRWEAVHPSNPAITQAYYSMGWLIPSDSANVNRSIDLFIEQAKAIPDPKSSASKDRLIAMGWSESAAVLRLKTALCLHLAAPSDSDRERLKPAVDELVAAVMDANRYYGPPKARPHNHGVMADRELLNASSVLGRPELATFAIKRLKTQLKGLYDTCGFTYEQSSSYQHFHAGLWSQIATRVADVDPAFRAEVDSKVALILQAALNVTYPDGNSPVIGDGKMKYVEDLATVSGDIKNLCRSTGWFSWRKTVPGGVSQQVITRFGPGTALHGHADKGSVNWWVKRPGGVGVQVLSDRGLPGKNRDAEYDYATGPEAHAVLLWPGGSDMKMSGSVRVDRKTGSEILRMSGSRYRIGSWGRTVTMSPDKLSLKIEDRVSGAAASQPASQLFPLDPAWKSTGKVGIYRTDSGDTLTISCTTKKGGPGQLTERDVIDYQLEISNPRPAKSVLCSVPSASVGLVSVLSVS